ncbi:hypothetical protein HanXRQr2_Chr14g0638341 [Helianthus annuus]|uniref:Uncharacterized protein n=1 Tax=Helianthus annuus TaxID=4232 RepID=A0A9K3EA36_HELAN|nr:hypothetical protein HanXRQr2_Chr14g0638341 [Helianthus annuus]
MLFLNSCLPLLNAFIKPFICGILIQNSILLEFDEFKCFRMGHGLLGTCVVEMRKLKI